MISVTLIAAKMGRVLRSNAMGIIILAASAMARAHSYAPWKVDQQRTPVHWLESFTTPAVWGVVWAVIAVTLLCAIVWEKLTPIAVGMVVAMHAAWCLSFTWQTIIGESPRAWVTAISYGSTAAIVLWAFSRAYPSVRFDIDQKRTETIPPRG